MIRRLKNQGFTLTEFIIVLAVSSILLAGVSANWAGLVDRSERSAALNKLAAAFSLARVSAIQRGHVVTICPLDAEGACSNNWNLPVAVFSDRQNLRHLEDPLHLIQTFPAPAKGQFMPRPLHKRYFQFRQDGMVRGTLGNVTYCPRSGRAENAGRLIVNMGGRVRLARDADGDGIVDGSDGHSIACQNS